MNIEMHVCPYCKGEIDTGLTIFTAKIGDGILVLENVPASICLICGEKWFSDEIVEKIENISNIVKKRKIRFEVISFDAA